MLEIIKNDNEGYKSSIFENLVLFASTTTILKQIPVPKFIQTIIPQCESTLSSRERSNGKTAKPGSLLIVNVTVNLPKDETKKKKTEGGSTEPEAASEIKPNIVIAPIKVSPMDDIKFDLLEKVFEKLGGPCSDALINGYETKAGDVFAIKVDPLYFGVSLEKIEHIAQKHLANNQLKVRLYT